MQQGRPDALSLLAAIVRRLLPVIVVVTALAALEPARETSLEHERAGALFAYLDDDGLVRTLAEGAVVSAGDRIQLGYDAGAHDYGVVFSVDDRGLVTLHFPSTLTGSSALSGARGLLPSSFVLDDAPGSERFYFVTSPRPLLAREVLVHPEIGRKPSFLLAKQVRAPGASQVR